MPDTSSSATLQAQLEQFNNQLHPSTTPAAAEQARRVLTALSDGTGILTVDEEDVIAVLKTPGLITTGNARTNDVIQAAQQAVANCPIPLHSARAAIVALAISTHSRKQLFIQVKQAVEHVTASIASDALIVFGTTQDPSLGEDAHVSVIAAGLPQD